MRRHYLLGSIGVLALSGLGFWTWRHFDSARAEAFRASTGGFAGTECPAAPPPAGDAEPPALETRVTPAKPMNSAPAGEFAMPPEFAPVEPQALKNPEYLQALHSQHRVVLEDDFRDLPKILGLAPDQSARLFDILAEQQVRAMEARWRKPEGGKSMADYYKEMRERNAQELAEFLGPSNMIRYKEFRANLEGRAEVNSVRGELARGWEPMRENQYDPLLAVVNVELQRLNQEIEDLGPRGIPGSDPATEARRSELTIAANQRILDNARTVLSGAQLASLAELYRRQRLQMETEDTLNRLRAEAAASMTQGGTPK